MKIAVAKLKAIDENLAFQVDVEGEMSMGRDGGESRMFTAFQKLEKDGKAVTVAFYWSTTDDFLTYGPRHFRRQLHTRSGRGRWRIVASERASE